MVGVEQWVDAVKVEVSSEFIMKPMDNCITDISWNRI